jgi:selenocysteine lyase/cysteine desulfurase
VSLARSTIGRVLAPVDHGAYPYPPEAHVDLFTNTTTAFTRVISKLSRDFAKSNPTLLTTDLEFPGCLAAIDDMWDGSLVIAQVAANLVAGPSAADRFLHDTLVHAFNVVKPRVVFLSHVMRTTGQAISLETLRYFREASPRVVIVLDGSQAVGNVVVDAQLLACVDFYIASGHKWLGGMTTSGFAWRRDSDRWDVTDRAQSLSHARYLGGSGDVAAWSSLVASIEDLVEARPATRLGEIARHNRLLATAFAASIADAQHVELVTPAVDSELPSGLVAVAFEPSDGRLVEKRLRDAAFEFTTLDYEPIRWIPGTERRYVLKYDGSVPVIEPVTEHTPAGPDLARTELRFCFHYWHSDRHASALAQAIRSAIATTTRDGRRARAS